MLTSVFICFNDIYHIVNSLACNTETTLWTHRGYKSNVHKALRRRPT